MALPFQKADQWLDHLPEEPDLTRISTPIRVNQTEDLETPETEVKGVDFSFNFRGTSGNDLEGNGRLFLPSTGSHTALPMVVSMHYEMDLNASTKFLNRGWCVITPHGERNYNAPNLMGDGLNHSCAMADLPRRLPFVDQSRLVLFGGSAGGYHALMTSSRVFPVTAVYAGVPPLNLKYNVQVLMKNNSHNLNPDEPENPPAPFVKAVLPIAEETWKGGRPDRQSWVDFSPTFRSELITSPTFITYSTADVLVPMNQLSRELVKEIVEEEWPEGFAFGMEEIVEDEEERVTFLETLDEADYSLHVVTVPRDSPTVTRRREDMSPEEESRITKTPAEWSTDARFSIVVLDEGRPEPFCAHTKYHHTLEFDDYLDYHVSRGSFSPNALNYEKLELLARRFLGKETYNGREYRGEVSWPITRLGHEHLEKWSVCVGLEMYIACGERNLSLLLELYGTLPKRLRFLDLADLAFKSDPREIILRHQVEILRGSGDMELAERLVGEAEPQYKR